MTDRRQKHDRPPLDAAGLDRLALAYAARYATSRAGLARYLGRKLAEWGWDGDEPADLAAITERFAVMGYVDDRALAEARERAFSRRGLGPARLGAALDRLGVGSSDRTDAIEQARGAAWETALRFAERRRLGPFAPDEPDRAGRAKALAAMLRAGHRLDHARRIIASLPGCVPSWDD